MTSEIFSVDVNAILIFPNYMEFFYIIIMAQGQLIMPADYTVHTHNNNYRKYSSGFSHGNISYVNYVRKIMCCAKIPISTVGVDSLTIKQSSKLKSS